MSEWQPIETAPKDGTKVLVYSEHDRDEVGLHIAAYCMSGERLPREAMWRVAWDHTPLDGNPFAEPTHWQPLPPEPQP
jgi:hypothetical protein